MKYLLYKQSGEIISCLTAEPEDLKINLVANNAYGYLEKEVPNTSLFYVASGCLIDKPAQPSAAHVFNWQTKQWVANTELAWEQAKKTRSQLLADSDWRVTKAAESGQPIPAEWGAYRQALRDITLQPDPLAIVWPVAP